MTDFIPYGMDNAGGAVDLYINNSAQSRRFYT